MVFSKIIPNLQYNESVHLASCDKKLDGPPISTTIHTYQCWSKIGHIVENTPSGIIGIQSIYLLDPYTKQIHSRIGICETGKDGKQHLLLFSTVTPEFIQPFQIHAPPNPHADADLFVPVRSAPSTQSVDALPPIAGFVPLPKLIEETPEIAATLRAEFVPSVTHSWVASFMKNAQYRTKENEGGGDCFFAAIRDAMADIGYMVSVEYLRNRVAQEMPEESFQVQKQMHLDMVHEKNVLVHELRQFQLKADQLRTYIQQQQQLSKQSGIPLSEAIKTKYNKDVEILKSQFQQTTRDYQTVSNHLAQSDSVAMATIQTMDQYRAHIRTSHYWADEVTLLIIERILRIKCIILSERNYKQSFFDGVLICTPNPIQSGEAFHPTHYIPLSYSGTHYKQITYKGRGVFTYSEIPFDLKTLIQNKCAENRNHGFSVIPEWSRYDATPLVPSEVDGSNPDILFIYHPLSADMYPGQGTGEHIVAATIPLFRALSKRTHWRRVLSDEYPCPIRLDSLQWPSVAHYLIAYPYRTEYKTFYKSFALPDGKNALLPTVELEEAMKKNKSRIPVLKAPLALETYHGIREMALMAKFTQHPPMAWILLLTRNASLGKFVRKKSPEIDFVLMKVRAQLLLK
jgi:hypothetical protein